MYAIYQYFHILRVNIWGQTGENGTGKSFFTKTLYSVFSIVNKNLLYIDATNNIQVSGAIIDAFRHNDEQI
jgi:predicted ATPase